jgi:hypothetical protein
LNAQRGRQGGPAAGATARAGRRIAASRRSHQGPGRAASMTASAKTALIKGMFKEVLRTLKDDGAYLQAQADQQLCRAGGAAGAWGAQPDAHRALARLQAALTGGDARALWAAGKLRAKARLQQAYAAVGRRYEEALGGGGGASVQEHGTEQECAKGAMQPGVQDQTLPAAAGTGPKLQELYGSDDWARVRRGLGAGCLQSLRRIHGLLGACSRCHGPHGGAWTAHACHAWSSSSESADTRPHATAAMIMGELGLTKRARPLFPTRPRSCTPSPTWGAYG